MKIRSILHKFPLLYLAFCLIISLIPTNITYAATTNNLKIYSGNTTDKNLYIGNTLCIDVKAFSVGSVSGSATGVLKYDKSRLQVVPRSIDKEGKTCSGKPASTVYDSTSIAHTSGTISFNASRSDNSGGLIQVFTVRFKAKASGVSSIHFKSKSAKVDGNDVDTNSITVRVKDNSPPASKPKPTPKPSVMPLPDNPATKDETVEDPSGYITDVNVDAGYESAKISWKVNLKNSSSTLIYGIDSENQSKKAEVKKEANGTFSTTLSDLSPGGLYYFTVNGKGGGKKGEYSSTVYTRGYPVTITATENDLPAANAAVQVGGINNTTDAKGQLVLSLAAGDYSGTITTKTASININFTVEEKPIPTDGSDPAPQVKNFALKSELLDQGADAGFSIIQFVGVLAAGIVLLGFGFVIFINIRRRRFDEDSAPKTLTQSVVIDDGFDWEKYRASQPKKNTPQLPSTPDTPAPPEPEVHGSSVYLDEEEPEDMFDFDKQKPNDSGQQNSDDTDQKNTP